MESVCVFCGSSAGPRPAYHAKGAALGTILARRGLRLVYGGGHVGLMGVVADAVLAAGGVAIGVIPEALARRELAHQGLTELRVVATMHERKAMMSELADAFIAMPGGFGTLEEFCEALTWAQLGIHQKPCGLLDVDGFYASLRAFFDHAVAEGFVSTEHRRIVIHEDDPERLLDALASYQPPPVVKWLTPRER